MAKVTNLISQASGAKALSIPTEGAGAQAFQDNQEATGDGCLAINKAADDMKYSTPENLNVPMGGIKPVGKIAGKRLIPPAKGR